ncbi:phage antirepressor KilAC domain-containing protein [Enterococcus casseliflavus]
MNTPQIFNFEQNEVRTILVNNEPFFVGKDVAETLGYSNTAKAIRDHVDIEDRRSERIVHPLGGIQESITINESGLYSLILKSKLPNARKFKRWVTSEVLPTIRKHGMYATQELLDDPDLLIKVATQLKEERNKRIELEQEKTLLESTIAEYEPKINYLDIILNSEDTVTASQIAQDYGMTPNQLNKLLNELKVQYKVNKQWILTKKYKGKGYVKSSTFEVPRKEGGTKVVMDTRWTQKGRVMLYELLKQEGYYPQMDLEEVS